MEASFPNAILHAVALWIGFSCSDIRVSLIFSITSQEPLVIQMLPKTDYEIKMLCGVQKTDHRTGKSTKQFGILQGIWLSTGSD
jgi:hypothetical protein